MYAGYYQSNVSAYSVYRRVTGKPQLDTTMHICDEDMKITPMADADIRLAILIGQDKTRVRNEWKPYKAARKTTLISKPLLFTYYSYNASGHTLMANIGVRVSFREKSIYYRRRSFARRLWWNGIRLPTCIMHLVVSLINSRSRNVKYEMPASHMNYHFWALLALFWWYAFTGVEISARQDIAFQMPIRHAAGAWRRGNWNSWLITY